MTSRGRDHPSSTTFVVGRSDARVYLGIHFRFADTAAAEMGQEIAEYGLDHYLERD